MEVEGPSASDNDPQQHSNKAARRVPRNIQRERRANAQGPAGTAHIDHRLAVTAGEQRAYIPAPAGARLSAA